MSDSRCCSFPVPNFAPVVAHRPTPLPILTAEQWNQLQGSRFPPVGTGLIDDSARSHPASDRLPARISIPEPKSLSTGKPASGAADYADGGSGGSFSDPTLNAVEGDIRAISATVRTL